MLALEVQMRRRDERLCAVLHHPCGQALREGHGGSVEVAEHGVVPSPANQAGGICADPREEERHRSSCMQGSRTDVCLCETDFWASGADAGMDGGGDLVAADDVLASIFIDRSKGSVIRGVVVAKIRHSVM